MRFPFALGMITCGSRVQVYLYKWPPSPPAAIVKSVCGRYELSLRICTGRGLRCNSSHHLSSTDICTGITPIFAQVYTGYTLVHVYTCILYIHPLWILLEYQCVAQICKDDTQTVFIIGQTSSHPENRPIQSSLFLNVSVGYVGYY